jgi:UDP-glucose 6-dehydrogenase
LPLKKQTKISVIGAGYVGLYTAVGFSNKGYRVVTSDVDDKKVTKINQGFPPFHEPGLQEKLKDSVQKGNLKCLVNQTEKAQTRSQTCSRNNNFTNYQNFFSPFRHN